VLLGGERIDEMSKRGQSRGFSLLLLSATVAACADPTVRGTATTVPALGTSASASPHADSPAPSATYPASAARPAALAGPTLPPLEAAAELVPLVVPEYRDAVVSLPLGVTEGRPIVLALHGNFDRPEWQCGVWREATKAYPFILCPRGVPRRDAPASLDRWTYGKSADVRREVEAALASLRARFGDYLLTGPIVYVGFSLGAILGAGMVAADPARFPRAVLIEGGQSGWSPARAKAYAASGGKRVLFACGQRSCKSESSAIEKTLGRAGLETRIVYGGEVGHTYDGPVAREIARAWPWLVGGDPRWPAP
jgi:predicted esterase